jgi:hypothetical protein
MSRFLVCVLLTAVTAVGAEVSSPTSDQSVTFNKDVLPILQKNCQTCHRPGEAAPMSFLTYESARPYAKAMKAAVLNKKMPPWFANPQVGEFRNAPALSEADVRTLSAWADGGAREGSAADKPAARDFADGWRIQPDVVAAMPRPYVVQARGAGEIKQFVIENPFKEDTWVSSIEIRPGDASVVHHAIVQVPEQNQAQLVFTKAVVNAQGQNAQAFVKAGVIADGLPQNPFGNGSGSYNDQLVRLRERTTGEGAFMTMEAVYAPGTQPQDFRFTDSAKLIRGGKPIRLEVHYTPNGKETLDQTKIGFTLAKAPAQRRFVIMAPEHLVDSRKPIPAGDSNYETKGELTFKQDADLVWFMPHMHLRGKDMSFLLIHPDGRQETVLDAKFNFNWQLGYEVKEPIKVEKGARMIVTAHHDNSANNPSNPDPTSSVAWGDLTSQEMMLPWFGVVVDRDVQPEMIASYKPGDLEGLPLKGGVVGGLRVMPPPPPPPPARPQPAILVK